MHHAIQMQTRSAAVSPLAHIARAGGSRSADHRGGFESIADFAASVRKAAIGSGIDQRLVRAAATTYGGEGVAGSGGYAVPIAFAAEVIELAFGEDSLLGLVRDLPIASGQASVPVNEATPWGSNGILADWEDEGSVADQTKPALRAVGARLKKLRVLVPCSDELLDDSAQLAAFLPEAMAAAVRWKTNLAIIRGPGTGQPLGVLNADSTITVDKETSQTAATINAANVSKMLGRCLLSGTRVVWVMNPDAYPQVMALQLNGGPAWQASEAAPNGLLLGRPIILSDACAPLGTEGDIILANMAGYLAVTRDGGPELATSMHLWFDQDVTAYRLVFRMDGQPALAAPVTPPYSSVTRSHFVTLATRS